MQIFAKEAAKKVVYFLILPGALLVHIQKAHGLIRIGQ
jgi:hypothetical protein